MSDTDESSVEKVKKSWGGARSNAGRPKHSKNPQTVEKEEARRRFIDRVDKKVDELFNAQYSLAVGVHLLFKTAKDDNGKDLPAVQVTDPEEIKAYIDGDTDTNLYYFIAAQKPDNKAITSMLDRAWGRPKESMDITSGDKPIQQPIIVSNINARNVLPQEEATDSN